MEIIFDPAKNAANITKHGISLNEAVNFEVKTFQLREDRRYHYGEVRYIATGMLLGRLHVMVFTIRAGVWRVISLRKANRREQRDYYDKKA